MMIRRYSGRPGRFRFASSLKQDTRYRKRRAVTRQKCTFCRSLPEGMPSSGKMSSHACSTIVRLFEALYTETRVSTRRLK